MRRWDLATGTARLELAMEELRKARHEVAEHWNDTARQRFEAEYLLPLEPRLRRALDGIHRLQELLGRAQRDCSDES
jgi:hypothetical protein